MAMAASARLDRRQRPRRRDCAIVCYMTSIASALLSSPASGARVGVRELRQNLSIYLDRVKRGEALTVTEHGQVVAVLAPSSRALSPVEQLIAEGRATPASRSLRSLPPPRRTRGESRPSEAVISEMREER